ncbi:MAG: 2-oxoglutarate dehydrogenase complex dihydrolipoyllysine-residue succinyltransferase [Bacteroidota bacterium]
MSVIELRVPEVGESITEVTLSQWLKNDGEYVELDEPICEFESDKATLEFPAEAAGVLIQVAQEDDDLEIGALVAKIDTSAAKSNGTAPVKTAEKTATTEAPKVVVETPAETKEDSYAAGHPSPAAAKLMEENGLTAADVQGTGKDGRITKEDVVKAIEAKKSAPAPIKEEKASAPEPVAQPSKAFSRDTNSKKMSRMRRTIARRLLEAKHSTAMLTTFNEVDLSAIMAMRKKYQERFVEKNGVKLGFMSLFTKACAKTLMEMPDVNAQIDGDHVIYHEYADISIAISTDNGLVVPPIRNAESKTFAEIELEIKALAKKARDGKLTLDEMSGGTFAITNGGIFGSMMSTPILNPPQSAILGMHTIMQRPVVVDGDIVVRPMMYLALSYDHRIIDGATSVTFLVKVKKLLEDPTTLLLDL